MNYDVPNDAVSFVVPAANWHLLQSGNGGERRSRFWHDALPGGGRVFTWENALLDRLADHPATIQVELHRNGDFIYRYDFSESGPPGGRPLPVGRDLRARRYPT